MLRKNSTVFRGRRPPRQEQRDSSIERRVRRKWSPQNWGGGEGAGAGAGAGAEGGATAAYTLTLALALALTLTLGNKVARLELVADYVAVRPPLRGVARHVLGPVQRFL